MKHRQQSAIRFLTIVMTLLIAALGSAIASAGSFTDKFKDKEDGWLDLSDWVLDNAAGFMPMPILITEPAVGEGFGVAALFFHAPKGYESEDTAGPGGSGDISMDEFVLPDVTVAAAAVTNNDSWIAGGGHIAHWKDDTIRYEGMLGYASINLKFFGFDSIGFSVLDGIEFNGEGFMLEQPISFRWKDTDLFIGAEFNYWEIETTVKGDSIIPGLPDLTLDSRLSGLGVFLNYDSLDTPFTPSSGLDASLSVFRSDDAFGSDFDYTNTEAFVRKYLSFGDSFFVGLRAEVEYVSGDVPFYMVPFISMRGMPAMRYQGEAMGLVETELRWAFHRRVSLVGFIGAGKAAESFDDFGSAPSRVARGLGVRYFAARKIGMHIGIDIAEGPEDTHWYLTFGGAWR